MKHLLIWTVGPVQDFIRSARKGRDLWFGSWLLGELARAAARELVSQEGSAAAVFPALDSGDEFSDPDFAVPNRIVALVERPEEVAVAMSAATTDRLQALAQAALDQAQRHLGEHLQRDVAMAQIEDLPEIAWASVPLAASFPDARAQAERLLAARKTRRGFVQPSWASEAPKSSFDGAREVVVNPKRLSSERRLAVGMKRGEALSGVDLFKRMGSRVAQGAAGGRIDSTTHIAARSYLALVQEHPDFAAALECYLDVLPERLLDQNRSHSPMGPGLPCIDAGVLYASRLREDDLLSADELAQCEAALQRLLSSFREVSCRSAPSPYYAVLLADGDQLGAHIGTLESPEDQRALGQALSAFAGEARALIAEHGGQVVYAGGDDVLALVPVSSAFATADRLRRCFTAALGGVATMSVGLCIGHHTSPLEDTLNGAREAERHAKDVVGRDAWAIKQDKRSGSPLLVGGKWNDDLDDVDAGSDMRSLVEIYAQRSMPRGLPYDLQDAERRLPVTDAITREELLPLHLAETRRILLQKGLVDGGLFAPIERSVALVGLAETARRLIIARNLGVGL